MLRIVLAAALCCACLTAPARAETCVASWYGGKHHGRLTANGERFNQNAMTAAHRTRPFGSHAQVCSANGCVTVRITDRGPFVKGRCIDLSRAAARVIGIGGLARVEVR